MHRSEIETVETSVGIRFHEARKAANAYGEPLLLFKVVDSAAQGSGGALGSVDCLTLRKSIHTYMSLANEVPGLHFNWSAETHSAELSALGKRLIACLDLYRKQLLGLNSEEDVERPWNSDMYVESANVRIFRKTLVQVANGIRKKHNSEYLSNIDLRADEIEALQRSVEGALVLMKRPSARRINKRLYDEMFKTNRSIQNFLAEVEKNNSRFGVLPLSLSFSSEQRFRLPRDFPGLKGLPKGSFPANYLDHFERASAFVSVLKKELNREVIGHLVKLTGANPSDPRCLVLLIISDQACAKLDLLKAQVESIWADHVLGMKEDFRSIPFAPGIKINALIKISGSLQKSASLSLWVDKVFIQELKYQRLRLPERRRSWAKSKLSSDE